MSHIKCLPPLASENKILNQFSREKFINDDDDIMELKLLVFSLRHRKAFGYIQIVLMIVHVIGCIYCFTGKSFIFNQKDHFQNDVVIFITYLSDLALVIGNIVAVICFSNREVVVDLLTFSSVNKIQFKAKCKIFSTYMNILRFAPLIPVILDIYQIGFKIGWDIYQYFLPRHIWFLTINLAICSFVSIIDRIKLNFSALNYRLEEIYKTCSYPDKVRTLNADGLNKLSINLAQLMDLSSHYNHLCNNLDKFNRHVKMVLILAVLCVILNILYSCTVLIEFGAKSEFKNGVETQTSVLIIQSLLALTTVGQAAVGALVGESLQDEGERTTALCYSILNKLNKDRKNENDSRVEKELNFLLDQSKSRRICLHAGGFFQVNWGILGSVTSTVATYSIVIIQFLLK